MEDIQNQIIQYIEDSEQQISSVKDNSSDLLDIAFAAGLPSEVANLLISESKSITNRVNNIEINLQRIKELIKQNSLRKEKEEENERIIEDTSMEEVSTPKSEISLRPQTDRAESSKRIIFPKINDIPFEVENQCSIMRELYSLSNNDYRVIDFSGIYPRLNYLQDSSPKEIRKWYDFGALNTIYLSSPDFPEIKELPHWIFEGVKDYYMNNPTVSPKDILMLKLFSAGPDFYQDKKFPAYHFIQIGKAIPYMIKNETKEFKKFEEKDIHYRRAIGIRIVLQTMENSFKKGFRTYGGKKMHSSVMISPAKTTPEAAARYLQTKIKWLESGIIESSPEAQMKLCSFRNHARGTCQSCSPMKRGQERIIKEEPGIKIKEEPGRCDSTENC